MDDNITERDAQKPQGDANHNPDQTPTKASPNNDKVSQCQQQICFNEQTRRIYATIGIVCSLIIAISTSTIVVVTSIYTDYARQQVGQMKDAVWESQRMRESSDKSSNQIVIEMGKQTEQMKNFATALEKADKTSRLRDRAFVYFLDPNISEFPASWGLSVVITNQGNIPARNIAIRCARFDVPRDRENIDPWPLARGKWRIIQAPDVIGARTIIALAAEDISKNMMNEAKNLKTAIFILMEVTYLDGFTKEHRVTQMSRILRYDGLGYRSVHFTRTHNCSNETCPK